MLTIKQDHMTLCFQPDWLRRNVSRKEQMKEIGQSMWKKDLVRMPHLIQRPPTMRSIDLLFVGQQICQNYLCRRSL